MRVLGYKIAAVGDGVPIHSIEYDIDDYVTVPVKLLSRKNSKGEQKPYTRLRHYKIRYESSDRAYFLYNRRKIYLDECIRTDLGEKP